MSDKMSANIPHAHILLAQLACVAGYFLSQSQDGTKHALEWTTVVAQYTVYLLISRGLQQVCVVAYTTVSTKQVPVPTFVELFEENKRSWANCAGALFIVLVSGKRVLGEDFLMFYTAYLVCQYLHTEKKSRPTINYGTGMACSFFEGYLKHVIPSDGKQDGFVQKIRKWEDSQGVVFPVKRLLLVVTKSLYCPPDLREFNQDNRHDLPQIEPCGDKSLEEVKKDVAGVKNRRYSNTTYRICWPDHSHPPVYIAAECATPLHTLYGVLQNHQLYRELVNADKEELVRDFKTQLQTILDRSPACRGKCVLVDFDDTEGSDEYLPTVLLNKIEELEKDYRQIIARHAADNQDEIPLHVPPRVLRPPN